MKSRIFYTAILLLVSCMTLQAQIRDAIIDLFTTDTIIYTREQDSLALGKLQEKFETSRLTEMNLRIEMEQLRMAAYAMDSVKLAQQKQRIDSMRSVTAGIPVVVKGDTLYEIYSKWGGHSPQDRAGNTAKTILELGKRYGVRPDSIYVESTEVATEIMYGGKVIASFTEQDGLWENTTRDELAKEKLLVIRETIRQLREEHSLFQLGKNIFFFILVIVLQYIIIRGINRFYHWLRVKVRNLRKTRLKPISFHEYELFDTRRQVKILLFFTNILRYVVLITLLILTVPILFSIFPQTENLALKIFYYIWNPVKKIFAGAIDYIPNLFTIFVIWYAIRYLVKGIRYLAGEIEAEKLRISGFYPDWAQPTFHIVRFCSMPL